MATAAQKRVMDAFATDRGRICDRFPAWFDLRRGGYRDALSAAGGVPSARDERYHLTDIEAIYARDWKLQAGGTQIAATELGEGADSIVLTNGVAAEGFYYSPEGLVMGSLCTAAADPKMREIVESYYGTAAQNEPLSSLNGLMNRSGAFVYAAEGVRAHTPVVIDCRYDGQEAGSFARSLVVVGKGASVDIVLLNRTAEVSGVIANSVLEIILEEGAEAVLSEFSYIGDDSTLLHNTFVRQAAGSMTRTAYISLGGSAARIARRIDLLGENAQADVRGLYLAAGSQKMAHSIAMNHMAANCRSSQLIKGVASGSAEGSFTGRVYVAPGAQKTEALQQSRNIELSSKARIYTRPQLEIYADDVKCSHGATVGQLDSEAIYYMRQRGIDLRTARKMQMEGFVHDITSHLGYGREAIEALTDSVLEQL